MDETTAGGILEGYCEHGILRTHACPLCRAKKNRSGLSEPPAWKVEERISLRDYFAAAALTGMISEKPRPGLDADAWDKDMGAAWCYAWADAMIAARKGE